jgi:hypothetical protein
VIADEERLFHGAGWDDARLADSAIDEKKNEADPKPCNDFPPDFLFGGEFFLRFFWSCFRHESPKQAKIFKICETTGASEFRWDE